MAEQFKVGDWVEVVDNSCAPWEYTVGEVVQVERVGEDGPSGFGNFLSIVGKEGSGMYTKRFKKASPPLPDVFQFTWNHAPKAYTATKTKNGYDVTWADMGFPPARYSLQEIKGFIEQGIYKILPPANGVDGHGEPMHFTKDMLKPMMRVTTMNGDEWIAAESVQRSDERYEVGDMIGVSNDGFNKFYDIPDGDDFCRDGYVINKVYGPPHNYDLLNPSKKGPLIWKRAEQPKAVEPEPSPLQKRLDYLQVHIDAVKENVESLEKEMKELQEEAGNV